MPARINYTYKCDQHYAEITIDYLADIYFDKSYT